MINLAKKRDRLLKLWPQDHVASCWRSQIRCHAPGISQPLIGGDFSLPVWLCTEVGWDLFTLHQRWTVVPAWEQPHTCLRAATSLIALKIPRRGFVATPCRKEMPGAGGSVQFVEGEVFHRCENEGQHSQFTIYQRFAGEQDSLWNSLWKAQPGTDTTPCSNSLSQKFLPPYSFPYTQYLLHGMERHLQHCKNHVMLCTEIWGEAHLCSTMLVFVCICVCIVNKKML